MRKRKCVLMLKLITFGSSVAVLHLPLSDRLYGNTADTIRLFQSLNNLTLETKVKKLWQIPNDNNSSNDEKEKIQNKQINKNLLNALNSVWIVKKNKIPLLWFLSVYVSS